MSLVRYRAKRDFRRTSEPASSHRAGLRRHSAPSFVIQKHAASRLHYDFRLEIGGNLKSWAVPKGVPTQKGEKRLAVRVEDHPLDYAGFEGTIPAGNYGAGTVMVWDAGHFEVVGNEPEKALEGGKLVMRLHGKKLEGEWTLVRMRGRGDENQEPWLLIKTGEDARKVSASLDDTSVQSGRSMKQISGNGLREDKDPQQVVRENPRRDHYARQRTRARGGEIVMPGRKRLRGVGPKERRMYEHIKKSAQRSGRYGKRAKEVAARTVMKHHRQEGHAKGH